MMRVLVTGATGFVGRHLCEYLAARGYQVRAAVRSVQQGEGLRSGLEWTAIGEIGAHTEWASALEGVDYVVHLAGHAHQMGRSAERQADAFFQVNAAGTRRLADAVAASASVRRLVFVSSVGAVRSISDDPVTDSTPPEPENDYGRSKLAAEEAIRELLGDTSPDWCIIRPPLVYGPGNPGNMARLLRLMDAGTPLPLGGIRNRRSFIYVGNLVDVIERCMRHDAASRRAFLVSDMEDLSTPDLVRRLAGFSRRPARLLTVPSWLLRALGRLGDGLAAVTTRSWGIDTYSVDRLRGSLVVDVSAIHDATGWRPPYTVDQGLAKTLHNPVPDRRSEAVT